MQNRRRLQLFLFSFQALILLGLLVGVPSFGLAATGTDAVDSNEVTGASGATGDNRSTALTSVEKLLHQKAKTRSYPGGADEESLKVLPQLPSASRKMLPAQEPLEVAEPAEGRSEGHSEDGND